MCPRHRLLRHQRRPRRVLENLFLVDNVEIPNINAFANFASAGGTVSLLDAQFLQDVTFLTGACPAPSINRTSSVLQVTQREGNRERFGGWATLGSPGTAARTRSSSASSRASFQSSASTGVSEHHVPHYR